MIDNRFDALDELQKYMSEGKILEEVINRLSDSDALGIIDDIVGEHDIDIEIRQGSGDYWSR